MPPNSARADPAGQSRDDAPAECDCEPGEDDRPDPERLERAVAAVGRDAKQCLDEIHEQSPSVACKLVPELPCRVKRQPATCASRRSAAIALIPAMSPRTSASSLAISTAPLA